ncbi:MAG: Fic family protein [Acidimicrobiales bacterium]
MMATRGRPSRETVYHRFAAAIDELGRFGGLPSPSEARQIWDDIWHLETHNSTALEGNTLVLREVEVLLEEGRAVGAKALKDYMEVLGYAEAARWVYGQAIDPGGWTTGELLSLTELRNVHRIVMAKVWEVAPHPDATEREKPGSFREHDIHPFGGGMQPPSWPEVLGLVADWVKEVVGLGAAITSGEVEARAVPAELAGIHGGFERIHPFLDGNGRTGRLVLNLVLVRLGYPPAVIFKRQRDAYLEGLDRADKGDPGPLAELIARSVIDNLHRFVVPNIAGPARLVPLASLATGTMSYEALRQAARRGRLEAEQGSDGVWRSSRRAVTTYERGRFRRGR